MTGRVIDFATEVRRFVLAVSATFVIDVVFVAIETGVGITAGWRFLLNQAPIFFVFWRVMRWSAMEPTAKGYDERPES